MVPNHSLLSCTNIQCGDPAHRIAIDQLSKGITECCDEAAELSLPSRPSPTRRGRPIPGWRTEVEPLRRTSLFWHHLWLDCGKPNAGVVYEVMKKTRREYHYAIRRCKSNELLHRRQRIAEAAEHVDQRDFWEQVKRANRNSSQIPVVVDEAEGPEAIAALFADKYQRLYQGVPTPPEDFERLRHNIADIIRRDQTLPVTVSSDDVSRAVRSMKTGKSDGEFCLYSDHLIHGGPVLHAFLAILFNCMLMHGYTPHNLLNALFISIPKDPRSSLCKSSNYRSIALSSVIGKVLDVVIMTKCSKELLTSNLQFGFKKFHSSAICTTVFKEIVHHYVNRGSNVYSVLLDASKAFDNVHFGRLFDLLLERNVPCTVIRVLLDCYTRQCCSVFWGGTRSASFEVFNGVKQGGILSPVLFSVYIDSLLSLLASCKSGCYVNSQFAGALCYADDLTLLSPSLTALNDTLNTCVNFTKKFCITFNERKTVAIYFGKNPPKTMR